MISLLEVYWDCELYAAIAAIYVANNFTAEVTMPSRILHISTWKTPCGIATYCENFVRSLEKAGFENDVLSLTPSEWPDLLPIDVSRWCTDLLERAKGFDLVHIQHEHGLFGYALGQKFACKRYASVLKGLRQLQIPSVTTFHTDVAPNRYSGLKGIVSRFKRTRLWSRHVCCHFRDQATPANAIVHSKRTRKSFVRHGFPVAAINVFPHPCLAPRTTLLPTDASKKQLGFPADAKVVTIFGFLSSYKGHDLAIEAMKKLPENYHLAMVGGMHPEASDTYMDKLVATIPESLQSRIRITGWVNRDTADLYFSATDICLAPYRANPELSGSGAVTWALSSGRPVIASKIPAFQNVNRSNDCMLMFTPGCINELAWAIQKVAHDELLSHQLVRRATEFCLLNSWDLVTKNVTELYRRMGVDTNRNRSQENNRVFFEASRAA